MYDVEYEKLKSRLKEWEERDVTSNSVNTNDGAWDRGKAVGVKPTYSEGTTGTTARIRNVRGLRDRHDVCQRDKKKRKFPPPPEADGLQSVQKNIFFLKKNQF